MQLEEAIRVLEDAAEPVRDTCRVPLEEGSGRVLAEDVRACYDQPPFPRSPLDGYAVRGEDTGSASTENPVEMKIIGKIYAGQVFPGRVGEGECVRLMTGAPMPDGSNAVIRQEDTDFEPGRAGDYTGPDSRMTLIAPSDVYDDNDFVDYTAKKVSVSDTAKVHNGQTVIV